MTHETEKWWKRLDSVGTYASRISAILLLLGSVFIYFKYVRDFFVEFATVPARLDAIETTVETLSVTTSQISTSHELLVARVDLATQPKDIFEVDMERSGVRGDSCQVYGNCAIDVRMRRTPDGVSCNILQDRERFFFTDVNGVRLQVPLIGGTPVTQIGREWFEYHWTFEAPAGMESPVFFEFEAYYTGCRSEDDNAVIVETSEAIPVTIIAPVNHLDNESLEAPQ